MAYLTKNEVQNIIANAPAGTTPGGIVAALRQQGHQLEGWAEQNRPDPNAQDPNERGLIEKAIFGLGNITGVTKLGQGIAAAINAPRNQRLQNEGNAEANRIRDELTTAITEGKKAGRDTTRLERALAQHNEANRIFNADMVDMADQGVTNRDVIGSAVRTAGTIASFGTYGAGAQGATSFARLRNVPPGLKLTSATSALKGAVEGAKVAAKAGAKSGTIFGALQGLGLGIQDEEKGAAEVAGQAVTGGVTGGIAGGIVGGLIGAVGGALQARANFRAQLEEKIGSNTNSPYVERMKTAAKETADELGDSAQEVKIIKARNAVKSSEALPIDDAIAAGDITPDQIYKDPTNKILQPEFAKGRVLDVRLKLNAAQPGLGDDFARGIDINNTTYDEIVQRGLDKLDEVEKGVRTVERAGTPSAETALFKRDPKTGKIVGDVDAKKLMRATGLEDGDIAMIKSGTTADKKAALEMLDMADELKDNPALASQKKPSQVAGRNALKQIRAIESKKQEAGRNIGQVVRKQLASKNVNTGDVYRNWVNSLADDGVTIADDGTLNFTGSRFEDVTGAQELLTKAHKKATALQGRSSAMQAHNFKGQLDELVDFGNNEGGVSGSASRLVKGLRRNIDTKLDSSFKVYADANKQYADASQAMERINSIIGKKYTRADEAVIERKVGGVLQRLFSNNDTTAIDLTTSIDDAMVKLGLQSDDTITNQAYMARLLEDIYGAPKSSLAGRIVQANDQTIQKYDGLRRLAKAPIETTVNTTLDIFDPANADKAEALRKYIEQLLAAQ